MSDVIRASDTCRLCRGKDLELVLQLTPTPIGSDYVPKDRLGDVQECYPIDIYLCHGCSYVGLLDVGDPEIIFGGSIEMTSMSLGVVKHLNEYADELMAKLKPAQGSLVVDIGSNDGTLLKFFQNHGMKVLGVDPSRYIAEKSKEAGIPTLCSYFTSELARSIKAEHGSAALITANRVIANVDDLTDMMEGVRDLLAPGGIFVFETGYLVDVVENFLFDTVYHEHLGYISVRAFKDFFPRVGMELFDAERVPLKGGSLRGYVQLDGGAHEVKPSVGELIALEDSKGFNRAEPFQALDNSLTVAKSVLLDLMGDLRSKGKSIAGYGASVGSTTQIYHLGVGEYLTDLYDDDRRNQNLFSPGFHIPVLSPDKIYDNNPDYIVILAWRYAEPIMKKHQAFLDQGGHFIVPLPELQVV